MTSHRKWKDIIKTWISWLSWHTHFQQSPVPNSSIVSGSDEKVTTARPLRHTSDHSNPFVDYHSCCWQDQLITGDCILTLIMLLCRNNSENNLFAQHECITFLKHYFFSASVEYLPPAQDPRVNLYCLAFDPVQYTTRKSNYHMCWMQHALITVGRMEWGTQPFMLVLIQ